MKPLVSYFICCVPRTGSWLLSESLQFTQLAGKPREYFAPEAYHQFLDQWKLPADSTYSDFLARLDREAATPNGVWGAKAHWYQFSDLMAKLCALPALKDVSLNAHVAAVFPNPRYIYLTRRDRVRHAVSYARAAETKAWWNIQGEGGLGRRLLLRTPQLNITKLDRMLATIVEHNRLWRKYFRQCGISPLRIYYEDLARDPATEVRKILAFLDIPHNPDFTLKPSRLRKQSDELSELWVKRYRRIIRARRAPAATDSASAQ